MNTEQEQLREEFINLISAYSEDTMAAGWSSGIEESLRARGGLWTAMAVMCGGWPQGYRGTLGFDAVTPDEMAEVRDALARCKQGAVVE